jgi:hypothetical protein
VFLVCRSAALKVGKPTAEWDKTMFDPLDDPWNALILTFSPREKEPPSIPHSTMLARATLATSWLRAEMAMGTPPTD